jgi:tRNA (guanine-N7-)-methyltransferase
MSEFWCEIFGNERPVEVEVGPGTGTFILGAARQFRQANFFGIENSRSRTQHLEHAVRAQGVTNARIINADAACVICSIIPTASVAAYHIYFPDPWWKRRHHRRRLFTSSFVAGLARTLVPGGRLYTATDVDQVFDLLLRTLEANGLFTRTAGARSTRFGLTAFERKGLARGAMIHEAVFLRHDPGTAYASMAAPMTPAESPSRLRRSGVRSSSLNT